MTKNEPRTERSATIAVLLATYNGARYLPEQVRSLQQQTLQNFVCYIHDDGSQDGTDIIIDRIVGEDPEHFTRVEGYSGGGAKNNFLFLLNKVEADYYFFCDQDDVWLPEKLERSLFVLKENERGIENKENNIVQLPKREVCVYSDAYVVDEDMKTICDSYYRYVNLDPEQNSLRDLLMDGLCVGCTMGINRALRNSVLRLGSTKAIIMHDWLCSLIASMNDGLVYIPVQLVKYRQHGDNTLGAGKKMGPLKKMIRAAGDVPAFLSRKRYYISRPRLMARELLEAASGDKKVFLKQLSTVGNEHKWKRILFYKRNRLYKKRENVIWQLLWV